jgi:hypothetical protein
MFYVVQADAQHWQQTVTITIAYVSLLISLALTRQPKGLAVLAVPVLRRQQRTSATRHTNFT